MKFTWELLATILGAMVFLPTLGWLIVRTLKRTEDPAKLIFKWMLTALLLGGVFAFAWGARDTLGSLLVPILCLAAGVILSIVWTPHIGAILARPLTSLYDGGDIEPDPQPFYSIALAKRKRGKPHEAVLDIRQQLERFPSDLTGQMLLAEIQVQDLNDLPGAQLTIERLVEQPGHMPSDIAAALNQLADWQWKFSQDPDAACATLQRLIERFPSTPMALRAAERIAHLSGSEKVLRAAADPEKIYVRPGVQNIGLLKDSSTLRPPDPDPAKLAEDYVRHLEEHPLNSEAREKLAVIYAHHYRRLDLAEDQLEQLIQQPNQPPRQVTRWLNLLADFQIKIAHDYDPAAGALQRIIDLFPKSAAAAQAQQRLAYLKLELKGQDPPEAAVPMGTYEQSVGLKEAWRRAQRDAAKTDAPAEPAKPATVQPLPGKPVKIKL